MENGISVYAGLGASVEDNIELIERAASMGLKKFFTSTQIPEAMTDVERFYDEFTAIIGAAVDNDFEIILDVNADNIIAFDFEEFTLRLDDGFDIGQVADLSRIHRIQLNASVMTEDFLKALANLDANFGNISALHNYYPHVNTGLENYYFSDQNKMMHDFGLTVGAFVASRDGIRRPPLGEGLTTLETTRNFSTDLSARYLAALGADFVMIGDGQPTDEELKAVATLKNDEIIIRARLLTLDPTSIELLSNTFTSRPEITRSVIRAVEGRKYLARLDKVISPDESSVERTYGCVTIDNERFGRYMGEVQIVEDLLPADERVNVAAKILEDENGLVSCIKQRQKFSFRFD